MSSPTSCVFVIPGDWLTFTGGYVYDRSIVLAMRDEGWHVHHVPLGDGFPWPDSAVLADTQRRFAAIDDDSIVIVDGLAFGAMPDLAERHGRRLRLVALVHHPLHLETGLRLEQRDRLYASEQAALRHARLVVVTSESTMGDVMKMGIAADRIAVVEPGVHGTRSPAQPPTAERRTDATVRLLCVATLVPRKGHAVLLEALSGLADLNWRLDCIGSRSRDVATSEALAGLTTTLGLDARVEWRGEMDRTQLEEAYGQADVFVLPSFYEGYGMVVAEAVSHGLPVVTTTGGALANTLPANAGLQVPPGDVTALRLALQRIVREVPLRERMAAGAKEAATRLPTWTQAAERFAALIEAVA